MEGSTDQQTEEVHARHAATAKQEQEEHEEFLLLMTRLNSSMERANHNEKVTYGHSLALSTLANRLDRLDQLDKKLDEHIATLERISVNVDVLTSHFRRALANEGLVNDRIAVAPDEDDDDGSMDINPSALDMNNSSFSHSCVTM